VLGALPSGRFVDAPYECGAAWFRSRPAADGRQGVFTGATPSCDTPLFDPVVENAAAADYWPSPDGRRVVVAAVVGSAEAGELRVLDAATGAAVAPSSLFTAFTHVSWLPDSSGFYFSGLDFDGGQAVGAIWYQS